MGAEDNFISKDFAKTFVNICFNIKEIKNLYDNGSPTSAKNIFNCFEELKANADSLIASPSKGTFVKDIESVRKSIQNTLATYENNQIPFDNKTELIDLLKLLDKNLASKCLSFKQK